MKQACNTEKESKNALAGGTAVQRPRRPFLALVWTTLCLIFSSCDFNSSSVPDYPWVEVHAHRGGSWQKPENTLAAFQCAIGQVGANAIELDVRTTADRMLVINHDPTLNSQNCLDPTGNRIQTRPRISGMTFAELRRYDCGTLVGNPRGTPIPSLDEVFETMERVKTPSGARTRYDIHVKWDRQAIPAPDYVDLILSSIRKHGVLDRVNILNDNMEILGALRKQEPTLNLYYLVCQLTEKEYANAALLKVKAVAPNGDRLDATAVQKLHQLGYLVIPWTVNLPYAWESLINMGADGIITDDPLGLREFLKAKYPSQAPLSDTGAG